MTPKEVALKAEFIREELLAMASVSAMNYRSQIAEYRRILNDVLVLIRELANKET